MYINVDIMYPGSYYQLFDSVPGEHVSLEVTFVRYMNRKSSLFSFFFLKANRKQISNKRLNTDSEEGVQRTILHVLSNDHHWLA